MQRRATGLRASAEREKQPKPVSRPERASSWQLETRTDVHLYYFADTPAILISEHRKQRYTKQKQKTGAMPTRRTLQY